MSTSGTYRYDGPGAKLARDWGFTPTGPRRPMHLGVDVFFNGTTQGANVHIGPTKRSIFVEELAMALAVHPRFGLAQNMSVIATFCGIWWNENPDKTKADLGAPTFYPTNFENSGDSNFAVDLTTNPSPDILTTGNASSIVVQPPPALSAKCLWNTVAKLIAVPSAAAAANTNAAAVEAGHGHSRHTVSPLVYIQEGSVLTLHADISESAAANLDLEMRGVLYYTPVQTIVGWLNK